MDIKEGRSGIGTKWRRRNNYQSS